jgi:hypothetical protein
MFAGCTGRTCHDEVHVHRFGEGNIEVSRTLLMPITSLSDVAAGAELTEKILFEEWEDNLRRWERGG